jgi:dTDP-4-dehydrorhamnose reductase
MKILILGASGYAGQAIAQKLEENHEVYGTYHAHENGCIARNRMIHLELSKSDSIKKILDSIQPQIIISSLRGNFQLQLAAHNDIADYLLENKVGKIIFLSSVNSFDAAKEKPHYESDKTDSQTDYGNFKVTCEGMLQEKLRDRCVIVRIPEIWGRNCPRILKLIEDAESDTPIATYPNVYVNYTTNIQIAEWIEYIVKEDLGGIFHIGTKDTYDYMRFQLELSRILGLKEPVFKKELAPKKCFQAVLPGRKEIPEKLQMKVNDVLEYLDNVQK